MRRAYGSILVVVLRPRFIVSASFQPEDDSFAGHLKRNLWEAVGSLDVVAIPVLEVEHGIRAIIGCLIRHLKGGAGAAVVTKIAILVVQVEEVQQVVIELRFQVA